MFYAQLKEAILESLFIKLTLASAPPGQQSTTFKYQKVFTLGDNNETREQWHALFPGKYTNFTEMILILTI